MRSDRNSNHRYDNMEDTGGRSKNSFFLMIVVLLRTPHSTELVARRLEVHSRLTRCTTHCFAGREE